MAQENHTCDGCQYRDHSGAFTSGGARLTCRHPLAKGEQDSPGDTPLSMFLRHGFTEEDAKLNLKGCFGSCKDLKEMPGEHHWIRRVRPSDGTAPNWCPEVPPKVLKERIQILREALEASLKDNLAHHLVSEMIAEQKGCSQLPTEPVSIKIARAALDATKEP